MTNNDQSYMELPSYINPDIYNKTSEELDNIDEDELDVAGGFIESKGKKLEEIPEYIKNNEFFLGVYSQGVDEAIGELYIARDVEDVNVPDEQWDLARQRELEVREAIQAVREKTEKRIDVTGLLEHEHSDAFISLKLNGEVIISNFDAIEAETGAIEAADEFIQKLGSHRYFENQEAYQRTEKALDTFIEEYAEHYNRQSPETQEIYYIPPDELRHVIVVQSEKLCDISHHIKTMCEIDQKAGEQQEKKSLSVLFTPEEKASLKEAHEQDKALGKGQEIEH